MKCLILAAGYATRLYPLTENFPKPLLKVGRNAESGEHAILDWLVDDIDSTGLVDEYIVVSNHKFASHFQNWAADKSQNIRVVDDGTSTNETRLGAVKDIQLGLRESREMGTASESSDKETKQNALEHKDAVLVIAGDNVLDFSFTGFIHFFMEKQAPCVMTHEENDLKKQQKTAIICYDADGRITSYEEKPISPKGNHAVPPFYIYRAEDIGRIDEALADGCGYDAPGSFAAWLSRQTDVCVYEMPGKRYDIGDAKSYEQVQLEYRGIVITD